jgi:hypothetical protein
VPQRKKGELVGKHAIDCIGTNVILRFLIGAHMPKAAWAVARRSVTSIVAMC